MSVVPVRIPCRNRYDLLDALATGWNGIRACRLRAGSQAGEQPGSPWHRVRLLRRRGGSHFRLRDRLRFLRRGRARRAPRAPAVKRLHAARGEDLVSAHDGPEPVWAGDGRRAERQLEEAGQGEACGETAGGSGSRQMRPGRRVVSEVGVPDGALSFWVRVRKTTVWGAAANRNGGAPLRPGGGALKERTPSRRAERPFLCIPAILPTPHSEESRGLVYLQSSRWAGKGTAARSRSRPRILRGGAPLRLRGARPPASGPASRGQIGSDRAGRWPFSRRTACPRYRASFPQSANNTLQ